MYCGIRRTRSPLTQRRSLERLRPIGCPCGNTGAAGGGLRPKAPTLCLEELKRLGEAPAELLLQLLPAYGSQLRLRGRGARGAGRPTMLQACRNTADLLEHSMHPTHPNTPNNARTLMRLHARLLTHPCAQTPYARTLACSHAHPPSTNIRHRAGGERWGGCV